MPRNGSKIYPAEKVQNFRSLAGNNVRSAIAVASEQSGNLQIHIQRCWKSGCIKINLFLRNNEKYSLDNSKKRIWTMNYSEFHWTEILILKVLFTHCTCFVIIGNMNSGKSTDTAFYDFQTRSLFFQLKPLLLL